MISTNEILNRIKKIILEREPSAKIYLYGSRARGLNNPNSDWDLLILLNKEKITANDEKYISYPLYDLEFETGEIISPLIYSEYEWYSKYNVTPLYLNVMNEGKLL